MEKTIEEKDKEIDTIIEKLLEISPEDAMEEISKRGLERKERVLTNEETVLE